MALPVVRRSERNDHGEPAGAQSSRWESPRWDAFGELERLHHQLARYLDSWRQWPAVPAGVFTPLADVEETDDDYLVEIELPGVKRDDVEIQIAGRRLSVHGERKEKERVGLLRRRERVVGRFAYEVTLPGEVDDRAIDAHFDEGVLTVRIPKPERARPRRIAIR